MMGDIDWDLICAVAAPRHLTGESLAALADELGVDRTTLQRKLAKWGRPKLDVCVIFWCDRAPVARGMCERCYARWKLGIDPNRPEYASAEVRERVRDEATRRRQAGDTIASIASDLGVAESTLSHWLATWGVAPPDAGPTPWPHGRPGAFITHGCRCEVCLPAFREYKQTEREKRLSRPVTANHGTVLAYSQGCPCDDCAAAMRAFLRERNDSTRAGATHHGQRWTGADAEIAYTRTDLTIAERAEMLGRTFSSVDNFIRAYDRRPDDPFGIKRA